MTMLFLSLGATLRAGPQQLLAEIGLQCGFTTGENFFEILKTDRQPATKPEGETSPRLTSTAAPRSILHTSAP